jgi:hypothetical protein
MRALRIVFLLLVQFTLALQAHDVAWDENPSGQTPQYPMVFFYPWETSDDFGVVPLHFENCSVSVSLNPVNSTLLTAAIVEPNPGTSVYVDVFILRAPSNGLETATISGTWQATGSPNPTDCTATNPNPFTVPITVKKLNPNFLISEMPTSQTLTVKSGYSAGLEWSPSLMGPWENVGLGQSFTLSAQASGGFFEQIKKIGGFLTGYVVDGSGNPQPNINVAYSAGGVSEVTDDTGYFDSTNRLPYGQQALTLSDTNGNQLDMDLFDITNLYINIFAILTNIPPEPPTNTCNCTPWCAIGYGSSSSGVTPVFYSGGANGPSSGVANCETVSVTVTPPSGPSFSITPGTGKRQNSGANTATGTWTVTSVVCGKTATASLYVDPPSPQAIVKLEAKLKRARNDVICGKTKTATIDVH